MAIKEVSEALIEPFNPLDIEWRVQQAGEKNGKKWAMVLAYVTNRAIMERLDEVFGIDGWQNEFTPMPDGGIICTLKCRIKANTTAGSFSWVSKSDGADKTAIEATKGGLSNAMKRAAVHWGIGRYLYRLETTFVTLLDEDPGAGVPAFVKLNKEEKGRRYYFARPKLPAFAMPKDLK